MKKNLRRESIERRRSLPEEERLAAGRVITGRLAAIARALDWKLVSCYLGYEAEVPTHDFVAGCLRRGIRVAVPCVEAADRRLHFSEIIDLNTGLTTNCYGIKEPRRERLKPLPPEDFDGHIVPGCAFDAAGHRLGYGLGFYDRALAGIRGRIPVIGLAFHSQIVADIPAEEHDVSVDLLITEERCYFADGGLGARLAAAVTKEEICL